MTNTPTQLDKFSLLTEESNFDNSFNDEELKSVATDVASFYKTLLAVAGRNKARRRIAAEVFQTTQNLGLGGSQ